MSGVTCTTHSTRQLVIYLTFFSRRISTLQSWEFVDDHDQDDHKYAPPRPSTNGAISADRYSVARHIRPFILAVIVVVGRFSRTRSTETNAGPVGTYEDPFLYSDQRGSWHLLYHVYNTTENPPHGHECVNSTVSAHAYSLDGFHWFVSPHQPYTTQILLTSGETITVATRERPKLWFDKHGQVTHLFTAVCGAPNCPNGPPTGCVDCKFDNWDYTLVQPLDV